MGLYQNLREGVGGKGTLSLLRLQASPLCCQDHHAKWDSREVEECRGSLRCYLFYVVKKKKVKYKQFNLNKRRVYPVWNIRDPPVLLKLPSSYRLHRLLGDLSSLDLRALTQIEEQELFFLFPHSSCLLSIFSYQTPGH